MKLKVLWWKYFNKPKYRTYQILCWIKATKEWYQKDNCIGLCSTFLKTTPNYLRKIQENLKIVYFRDFLELMIPEFYPEFFGASKTMYWWPIKDTESRIKALDKLIEVYTNKLKE